MKHHKSLVVCGLIYTMCLCFAWGIDLSGNLWNANVKGLPRAEGNMDMACEERFGDALQYVNAGIMVEKPKIAITFDDGPNALCTPFLLDGLRERGIQATFFLIGQNVEKNQDLVRKMSEEGHLIGNHTYHHVEITKVSDAEAYEEIKSTSELIFNITGSHTEYMRPPFGVWQKGLEENLDICPVLWSIDPLDWTTDNVDEIVNKVVTEVQEGDIILLHDCYKSSVEAALQIIDILEQEGYEFVTVDKLIMN